MFKKLSQPFLGFLQASGLVGYLVLIAAFLSNVEQLFEDDSAEFIAPIMMLLLFIISAVTTASLVLGRAGVLFWEKKYSEAFTLVFWTVGWGLVYFLVFFLILALTL